MCEDVLRGIAVSEIQHKSFYKLCSLVCVLGSNNTFSVKKYIPSAFGQVWVYNNQGTLSEGGCLRGLVVSETNGSLFQKLLPGIVSVRKYVFGEPITPSISHRSGFIITWGHFQRTNVLRGTDVFWNTQYVLCISFTPWDALFD